MKGQRYKKYCIKCGVETDRKITTHPKLPGVSVCEDCKERVATKLWLLFKGKIKYEKFEKWLKDG